MPLAIVFAAIAVIGFVLVALSLFALRSSGASPAVARRLAGPPELKVGRLLDDAASLPRRPVRLAGRIRCTEPLDAGDGERLVAFHRDVEVLVGDTWRSVERLRETRSFELWDHDGSLTVDPAAEAEPLITIPHAWHGSPDELEEPHASAAARLAERHGPLTEARAVTRTLNVTDRLLVLAQPVMRLLGGRHRRAAAAGVVGLGLGIALVAIGGVGALLAALIA